MNSKKGKDYFKDKNLYMKTEQMTVCIQCQGIGYIKNKNEYTKCVMCNGDIYITKHKVASILGRT